MLGGIHCEMVMPEQGHLFVDGAARVQHLADPPALEGFQPVRIHLLVAIEEPLVDPGLPGGDARRVGVVIIKGGGRGNGCRLQQLIDGLRHRKGLEIVDILNGGAEKGPFQQVNYLGGIPGACVYIETRRAAR